MTDCGILVRPQRASGWVPAGSGFALAEGVVITANHVVRDQPAADVLVQTPAGIELPVAVVTGDPLIDVAVLRLPSAPPSSWRPGRAGPGVRWIVTSRPRSNDPQLTGSVAALDRLIVNKSGHEVAVFQLTVDQPLEEFKGYSGSAVRLESAPATVVGVLCEQVPSRLMSGRSEKRPATNVLYAVPMTRVAQRFDLNPISTLPATTFDGVRSLLNEGRPADADRVLQHLPNDCRQTADFWYWKARVALTNHNLTVALAYADKGLTHDNGHAPTITVKIKILLLQNTPESRVYARQLTVASGKLHGSLDAWIECLRRAGLLADGLRTPTELDRACPFPDDII